MVPNDTWYLEPAMWNVDAALESGSRPRLFAEPESGPAARYGINYEYISIMC